MAKLLTLLTTVAALILLSAGTASATASVYLVPVPPTLQCGSETIQLSGYFRVVSAVSTGATVNHVTTDGITGIGSSGTQYRLVGAGNFPGFDIVTNGGANGSGATTETAMHHGTLIGAGGQPIHPLMFIFHSTTMPDGQISTVSIDMSDCV